MAARLNFLAQDRCDIQYATKEVMRHMSNPRESHWEKLKRLVRYLKGRPRYVILYRRQSNVHSVNCFTDSVWTGDKVTRKSTSGGCENIGDHCVKSWSSNQSVIALSSGEAEPYSLTKGCSDTLGLQSLLADMGIELAVRVMTDASTGKAIASRRGLGTLRHIASQHMNCGCRIWSCEE